MLLHRSFFNEIRSFGTSEIACGSEILLRNVKCASHVLERILFHLMRSIKFHNALGALFHIPRKRDISQYTARDFWRFPGKKKRMYP